MEAMDVSVKSEVKIEPVELESRILELCRLHPGGLSNKVLTDDVPHLANPQRVAAINRLLTQGQIIILSKPEGPMYKIKEAGSVSPMRSTDKLENIVYQIVEEAGNKAIWTKTAQMKSGIDQTSFKKVLKTLKSKNLIKEVKSVNAVHRAMLMLFNLKPHVSISGGKWYGADGFDSVFVDVLYKITLQFLTDKTTAAEKTHSEPLAIAHAACATPEEVCKHIIMKGISKEELTADDMEMILDTVMYDGLAERTTTPGRSGCVYRTIRPLIRSSALVRNPCGICPNIRKCRTKGDVSAEKCEYLDAWLPDL